METGGKRPLINELTQGRELANQLKNHLDLSAETSCESLVEKILCSYEKALSLLNNRGRSAFAEAEDTCIGEFSPRATHVSDPAAADSDSGDKINVSKKRRKLGMGKWSEQVKVSSGTGGTMVEGPLSDGYSWRKYGQKDILGANHPRAYYRCTHRNVQGCLATKQVQRSDEDSSVFEITYRGRHTCIQANQLSKALQKLTPKQENVQDTKHMDRAFSFKLGADKGLFPSFSFATTPIETQKLENLFDSNTFITLLDHNFQLQTSDSDFSDIINSTPNSVTNSPFVDWDISLDHTDFSGNFLFDVTDSEMFA